MNLMVDMIHQQVSYMERANGIKPLSVWVTDRQFDLIMSNLSTVLHKDQIEYCRDVKRVIVAEAMVRVIEYDKDGRIDHCCDDTHDCWCEPSHIVSRDGDVTTVHNEPN